MGDLSVYNNPIQQRNMLVCDREKQLGASYAKLDSDYLRQQRILEKYFFVMNCFLLFIFELWLFCSRFVTRKKSDNAIFLKTR